MDVKQKIGEEIHIKYLIKAKTARIDNQEMTVLPYGFLGQAVQEAVQQAITATKQEWKEEREQMLAQLKEASKVYWHITNGLLAKTNYDSETVIAQADEYSNEVVRKKANAIREQTISEAKWWMYDTGKFTNEELVAFKEKFESNDLQDREVEE